MPPHIKSSSARLPVPRELHIGAVIGTGACNVKRIQTKYGVRCQVDAKKREVSVTGPRAAIDGAIDGLQDLFHRLRLERMQYLEQHRQRRTPPRIYRIAALTDAHDSWMFQRLPGVKEDEKEDESYDNRLVRLESFDSEVDDDAEEEDTERMWKWIEKFDAGFQRRMVQDVDELVCAEYAPPAIKIKAALGLTFYALSDEHTACRSYSWGQLQDLKSPENVRRRWSNICNWQSPAVSTLVRALEARIPSDAEYETLLTVYVGYAEPWFRDISVKFMWSGGKWVPCTQRPPIREPHGLYNITLDDETAFRIRVYSREYPSHPNHRADLQDDMELTNHPSGDPLRTEVRLRSSAPNGTYISMVSLRSKVRVDYEGACFSISWTNAARTQATIQSRCLGSENAGGKGNVEPAQNLRDLVDKMQAVLS